MLFGFISSTEGRAWASEISKALAVTFVQLDEDFARIGCSSGEAHYSKRISWNFVTKNNCLFHAVLY